MVGTLPKQVQCHLGPKQQHTHLHCFQSYD